MHLTSLTQELRPSFQFQGWNKLGRSVDLAQE
jgi:hypothetical protein